MEHHLPYMLLVVEGTEYYSSWCHNDIAHNSISMPFKLPWIFVGALLTFNGAPGNIQGNFIVTTLDNFHYGSAVLEITSKAGFAPDQVIIKWNIITWNI